MNRAEGFGRQLKVSPFATATQCHGQVRFLLNSYAYKSVPRLCTRNSGLLGHHSSPPIFERGLSLGLQQRPGRTGDGKGKQIR